MREIKFRAWDKESKNMIYGSDEWYQKELLGREIIEIQFVVPAYNSKNYFVLHYKQDIYGNIREFDYEEYREGKVMQYTGLHDKNGKEIWEGDVISYDLMDRPNEYIEFKDGAFQVSGTPSHINMARHGEVIGNIYQNPELI